MKLNTLLVASTATILAMSAIPASAQTAVQHGVLAAAAGCV